MIILLLAIPIILLLAIQNNNLSTKAYSHFEVSACPPHKWVYDHLEKLYCDKCKKTPTQVTESLDK